MIARLLVLGLLSSLALAAYAESFTVSDIRIRGLQRIPVERVYSVLAVQAGTVVDERRASQAIRDLYRTGDFQDVQVGREGDVLVVTLSERPAVSSIEITGNKSIDTEQMLEGLKQAGLAEGEVFRRATLENLQVELQRQYIAQGRYGAKIDTEVTPQPRNRVAIAIDITEGQTATIGGIGFIGNTVFDDETLREVFKLRKSHFWSFIKGDDKYAREKLGGDLEALRSYYMDRGYINYQVESTQVSVTPDREQVFINVGMSEGEKYTVSDVALAGNLIVDEKELRTLLLVRPQQVFSQALVTATSELISKRLGLDGYIFAQVRAIPELNDAERTVKMTFFVEPGDRMYVDRILFTGNSRTRDEVLRREMRQFEGAPASQASIELSKRRLEQLGFFSAVTSDTPRVPGTTDRVDLAWTVEEQPSGSIGANIGYSQGYGLIFGASVSQNNWFGTGNRVSFAVSQGEVRDSVNVAYNNPYYTDDGVSRGWNLYYTETDYSQTSLTSYALDRAGGNVSFGYPISELARLSFKVGYDNAKVTSSLFAAEDVFQYLLAEGDEFESWLGSISWSRSTLNRGILADRGSYNTLGLEAAVPGSDVTYYKLSYSGHRYFPLTRRLTLKARADAGYGAGYGDSDQLPFFQRFTSGGFGSVRGFEDRTLGARSPAQAFVTTGQVDLSPDPVGGNLLLESGLELIVPTPFAKDSPSVRTSFFLDAGNVFLDDSPYASLDFAADELRLSAGVSLSWYTLIGPLSFSLAKTLNDQPGDERQAFQFSLGQPF